MEELTAGKVILLSFLFLVQALVVALGGGLLMARAHRSGRRSGCSGKSEGWSQKPSQWHEHPELRYAPWQPPVAFLIAGWVLALVTQAGAGLGWWLMTSGLVNTTNGSVPLVPWPLPVETWVVPMCWIGEWITRAVWLVLWYGYRHGGPSLVMLGCTAVQASTGTVLVALQHGLAQSLPWLQDTVWLVFVLTLHTYTCVITRWDDVHSYSVPG